MDNTELNKKIARLLGYKVMHRDDTSADGFAEEFLWVTPPELAKMGIVKFSSSVPDFLNMIRSFSMIIAVHHDGNMIKDNAGVAALCDLDIANQMYHRLRTLRARKVGEQDVYRMPKAK